MTKPTQTPDSNPAKTPIATGKKGEKTDSQKTEQSVPTEEEIGGPKGPEPTRFGDWEQKGRCSDF